MIRGSVNKIVWRKMIIRTYLEIVSGIKTESGMGMVIRNSRVSVKSWRCSKGHGASIRVKRQSNGRRCKECPRRIVSRKNEAAILLFFVVTWLHSWFQFFRRSIVACRATVFQPWRCWGRIDHDDDWVRGRNTTTSSVVVTPTCFNRVVEDPIRAVIPPINRDFARYIVLLRFA